MRQPHRLIVLTDSFVSIKLVQHELLRSKRTYKEIAAAAVLSSSTVSNIAIGHTKLPRLETIIRILSALRWVISASPAEEEA
jgi:transcriptional regulator with XRE-family HTH domain